MPSQLEHLDGVCRGHSASDLNTRSCLSSSSLTPELISMSSVYSKGTPISTHGFFFFSLEHLWFFLIPLYLSRSPSSLPPPIPNSQPHCPLRKLMLKSDRQDGLHYPSHGRSLPKPGPCSSSLSSAPTQQWTRPLYYPTEPEKKPRHGKVKAFLHVMQQ